jgi:1-acyl-sn-glycerol-3-phosphate acyltransferase
MAIRKLFSHLPGPIIGLFSAFYMMVNTCLGGVLVIIIGFLKLIIPIEGWHRLCSKVIIVISHTWIAINNVGLEHTKNIQWEVRGIDNIKPNDWYLVISNHQSWVDIVVLQKVFHGKIPFLKFFLKKELIWVPVLGLAWWALDFPFMKRYSKSFIKKYPHLKNKDIEITKKACKKFKTFPVSIINFPEGTRFSDEKQAHNKSPYKHLLKPKAGGVSFVLSSMGDQLDKILDVTIAYPRGVMNFIQFLCAKESKAIVDVKVIPITDELIGNYSQDSSFCDHFQNWLNRLWAEKDSRMKELLQAESISA